MTYGHSEIINGTQDEGLIFFLYTKRIEKKITGMNSIRYLLEQVIFTEEKSLTQLATSLANLVFNILGAFDT